MGKHNGKARASGTKVGEALRNNLKGMRGGSSAIGEEALKFRHTTDFHKDGVGIQSVLERNDLEELMAMADLAGKDFQAEKRDVVVISMGPALDPLAHERDVAARKEAELRNAHRLRIPRRPAWTPDMSAEQLDLQERTSFLEWRRELATLEETERLVLTPFEKNLEVWRQLWRVMERSDIVIQVVDARDPLLYFSDDLREYARELHTSKTSCVLLNKADLLPEHVRLMWADFFDSTGLPYAFFSAFRVLQQQQSKKTALELGVDHDELYPPEPNSDPRTHIFDEDELLDWIEIEARKAIDTAGEEDPRHYARDRRLMIGLIGYPNVGKSSTINAIFGSKKTAVAPTPGKTKHFQTLNVSQTICLCDCPGLVMPKFAKSKSEMVAAGVVPIDKLTEIRAPVQVVADRCGRPQLEAVYGLKLPVAEDADPSAPPAAGQLLAAYALMRGWTAGSGLPDESRAGRQMLKDYTAGKLLYCCLPPGNDPPGVAPMPAVSKLKREADTSTSTAPQRADETTTAQHSGAATASLPASSAPATSGLNEADLDLLHSLDASLGDKAKRPEYKFHKKAARSKGNRGQAKDGGGYDGAAMVTGKKGGLIRVAANQ